MHVFRTRDTVLSLRRIRSPIHGFRSTWNETKNKTHKHPQFSIFSGLTGDVSTFFTHRKRYRQNRNETETQQLRSIKSFSILSQFDDLPTLHILGTHKSEREIYD